ncbi:hypothetical protein [Methylophilus sp. 5]|uniref:hypothetical protein n=1 Tax=Methylophilus sp. 5 TaxID=1112274 RepID=UPI00049007CD|nr:hypothetical protein [Methylophilus sp. 5]
MYTSSPELNLLIGTLGAALIAAMFSFFNLISTKESKVSDFRQKWIDELRNDITSYVRQMELVQTLSREGIVLAAKGSKLSSEERVELDRLKEQCTAHLTKAKTSHTLIQLRINKKEKAKKAKNINEDFLRALKETYIESSKVDVHKYNADLDNVVSTAAELLKMEWVRVKKGEFAYRCSFLFAVAAIIIGISVLIGIAKTVYYKDPSLDTPKISSSSELINEKVFLYRDFSETIETSFLMT